jgi:6-pyruvoyltetrahydropterin/6-carboxytetrahydropterin synthase
MSEIFEARVTKDSLVFSAAHFITFNGNVCERLHGHNWRLDVTVFGDLDENCYVYDFIALRDACQDLVNQLDHRMLLPDRHHSIAVETSPDGKEVTARFEDRRWVFPAEDCVILPLENTTAELIARWNQRTVGECRRKFRSVGNCQTEDDLFVTRAGHSLWHVPAFVEQFEKREMRSENADSSGHFTICSSHFGLYNQNRRTQSQHPADVAGCANHMQCVQLS